MKLSHSRMHRAYLNAQRAVRKGAVDNQPKKVCRMIRSYLQVGPACYLGERKTVKELMDSFLPKLQ